MATSPDALGTASQRAPSPLPLAARKGHAHVRAAAAPGSMHGAAGRMRRPGSTCSACASCGTPHSLPGQAHGGGSPQARNRMFESDAH